MRKVIIVLLIIIVAIVAALYVSKGVLLAKFKSYLIEEIESRTRKGIRIEDIDYIPTRGMRLSGVEVYTDTDHARALCSVTYLDIKFPVLKLLTDKVFSPRIALRNFRAGQASVNGSFAFSMKPDGKIEALTLMGLSVKVAGVKIENLTGLVSISPKSIKTSGVRFALGKESCELKVEILDPKGKLSSKLEFSSPNLNLTSSVEKEEDVYKIREINGRFLDSSFEFIGELESLDKPVLSLYGKANVDIKDIAYFAPESLSKSIKIMKPSGKLASSVYFKGNLKDPSACEIGVKSNAEYIKMWNFKLDNFHMDMRLEDGILLVPLISAYPYGGVFVSSLRVDIEDSLIPYEADCKISGVNIADILEGTKLGKNNLQGFLFSEFAVQGNAKSLSSMRGSGKIAVQRANLGPMPLLTPLLGNLYGYLRHAFPELEQIDIKRGTCDFIIADRKISTENLVLMGDVLGIYARGYMDFDKNLNFDVENELIKPEAAGAPDWQTAVQGMIVNFGKFISKSHLGGTLDKPKWSFEYIGGMKNVLKGGLDKVLKGVLSE